MSLTIGATFSRWNGDTGPRFILDYSKTMIKYYDITALVSMAVGAKEHENTEGNWDVRCPVDI